MKDNRAIENTPMVDNLLAAGPVLHAQTAGPEFCFIPLPRNAGRPLVTERVL
jgi:hypothetical protein